MSNKPPITPCRPKWKGTLTDRERFNRQMHYQPVDRCFNMEFGYWQENFTQWKLFVDNHITSNGEADIFFSFDRQETAYGNVFLSPPFKHEVISQEGQTQIVRNDDGLIGEVFCNGTSTIPHFTRSSINNPEEWKQVKTERFRRDDPARKVDIAKLIASHPPTRDYPLGVWCGSMIGRVRDILTMEGLAYACFDYPDMVEDMVETSCLLVEDYLDQVLGKVDFDYACGWEDICFRSGPLVTLDFFKGVVVPRYKRINAKLKKHGIDIWWIDCDGDVRPILPYFLESGINCLFPFEVQGCAHVGELLGEYGKDLRIMGGVDKIEMAKGPDAITRYLKSLAPWVERGGYIPFCDHRCPPDVSPENYLFYLDLKERMFGMKG